MESPSDAGNNPQAEQRSTEDERARLGNPAFATAEDVAPRTHSRGFGPRAERVFDVAGIAVLVAFALAWTWSIASAVSAGDPNPVVAAHRVTTTITASSAPAAAYVTDAALNALAKGARGASGKLRANVVLPVQVNAALSAIGDFTQITLTPFSAKRAGRVGLYYIGSWPAEHGVRGPSRAPADRYGNPRGFIQVTPETQNTAVSEHFKLKDFLTHDQQGVWPKYLVLELRTVDKLELVLDDLQSHGINTSGVTVMSGFRTPQYNATGGETAGRADLSRHMYGDASDIFIDNDGNGAMDDLNHDGKVDINDSRVILEA
ncbi:MAG TPA: hypothetical protein VKH19_09790, partial [Gemmatimonadaceae bacterium]|nr:hypothetical protein [Gemmatimonadaceae bacterium]